MLTVMLHPNAPQKLLFVLDVTYYLFCFNPVTGTIMEIALFSCEHKGIDICSDGDLLEQVYDGNFVTLSEDSSKLQSVIDPMKDSAGMLGMLLCYRSITCRFKTGLAGTRILSWPGKN